MHFTPKFRIPTFAVAISLGAGVKTSATAADNGKFRIGIVTFLSGAAAGPFGVPAANAAKLTICLLYTSSIGPSDRHDP